MKKKTQTYLWLAFYFLMVFLPLGLLMIFPRPDGREFLREISVALGFLGMALLGLQTIPTSRLKFFTKLFPMDTLYTFHHRLSIFTFLIILVHPILLFINNPATLQLLNLVTAPWRARAGVIAVVAMLALVATSVWRELMKIKYDIWRWVHDALSFLAIGLALFHMFKVNYYMSLTYQKVIWLVLTGIWLSIILYIRVARPIIMIKNPYKVVRVQEERGQSWSLYLKPDGHEGMSFEAGQFAWITNESPFIFRENPFSFSTSSERDDKVIGFTIKELGDFTETIKNFKPGDTVYVDGPYGTFSMDEHRCKEMVYIAGGIGSAPVMSMLRTLADRNCEKKMIFFYGNPTWESVIYREELEEIEQKLNLKLVHVLERPPEGWEGETGFINAAILKRYLPQNYKDSTYFLCGPLPMIEAVEGALHKLHVPVLHIFSEQYEMA
ncbi:MAG: ferric reductase-like transmembrane domain-containing protein [Brevefilum sp.]|nr:ferric reductase-like transmembrane domain-containing protein [Brevefilum sp.]MDT8382244.1 ferric reductase-like transmembrane domain-containing protein [Brevefilum sp.]